LTRNAGLHCPALAEAVLASGSCVLQPVRQGTIPHGTAHMCRPPTLEAIGLRRFPQTALLHEAWFTAANAAGATWSSVVSWLCWSTRFTDASARGPRCVKSAGWTACQADATWSSVVCCLCWSMQDSM
jgi:hypothetical protein